MDSRYLVISCHEGGDFRVENDKGEVQFIDKIVIVKSCRFTLFPLHDGTVITPPLATVSVSCKPIPSSESHLVGKQE